MVFALLIAAILWNLGTWYFGLPASSSHTMVGSIIGVGIANQLMNPRQGTSGVDWDQALKIGESLLISPLIGFGMAALLLIFAKVVIKDKRLYEAPVGTEPPPFWIRGLLILTCTGVSFSHGSNDGQKGMGLIMLILVGTVPTAYALNHAVSASQTADFLASSQQTMQVVSKYVKPSAVVGDSRDDLTNYIRTRDFNDNTMLALRQYINDVGNEVAGFKQYANVPQRPDGQPAQRNVCDQRVHPADREGPQDRIHAPRTTRFWRITRSTSTSRPSSFRPGSRLRWRSRWAGHDDRLEAHCGHGG